MTLEQDWMYDQNRLIKHQLASERLCKEKGGLQKGVQKVEGWDDSDGCEGTSMG